MKIKKRLFGNEKKYINQVLNNQFRTSSGGKFMTKLEKKFCRTFRTPYAISFVNGTATMHACLEALGIKQGDEVIVPPLTMSSTAFSVLQANATPVFADVCIDSFLIDPESIKKNVNKKTKAIITVSLYGLSPDYNKIQKIAKRHNLKIIEDNAECFLGEYNSKLVGTFGDFASYSFQSSKHMTSGEGGMVITKNKYYAKKVRQIQSLGYAGLNEKKNKIKKIDIQNPNYKRHLTLGWNYRMPELCSAVALAQLENLNLLVKRRIEVANIFNKIAKKYISWFTPQKANYNYKHSYWTWAVLLNIQVVSWKEFYVKFKKNGGDGFYAPWKLTFEEPFFKNKIFLGRDKFISKKNLKKYNSKNLCPNAKFLQKRILQFKTNYWDFKKINKQALALKKTLSYFDGRKKN